MEKARSGQEGKRTAERHKQQDSAKATGILGKLQNSAGQEKLGVLQSMGLQRVGTTW